MDIQVGDRVTYKFNEEVTTTLINETDDIENFMEDIKNKSIQILKIERPKYEVIEEKKELLTEEEKEFIKLFKKCSHYKINGIKELDCTIKFYYNKRLVETIRTNFEHFRNLESNKIYTFSELGLED